MVVRGILRQAGFLRYSWLEYSVQANVGFFVPCILFGVGLGGVDPGVLVSRQFTNFKKAPKELKAHDTKTTHQEAVTKTEQFLRVMHGQQEPVYHQIDTVLADRVAANKQRLGPIVKTVLLCDRQNIALRGHDSAKQTEANSHVNSGNFRALLEFRIDAGDCDLGHLISTAPKNATYTSTTIQNELINIIGDFIHLQILECERIQVLLCDCCEVTDSANKEQLSLVLCYLDPASGEISEDLMEFAECDMGITSQADKILHLLQKFNLDPRLLHG